MSTQPKPKIRVGSDALVQSIETISPDKASGTSLIEGDVELKLGTMPLQQNQIDGLIDAARTMGDKIPQLRNTAYRLEQQQLQILDSLIRYYSEKPPKEMARVEDITNCVKLWNIFRHNHSNSEKYDAGKLESLLRKCNYQKIYTFLIDVMDQGYVYELD